MEKPIFPRRLFTKGEEPDNERSVGYYSNNTRLFSALHTLLGPPLWGELEDGPLGIFFKFNRRNFGWASKIVHCMLTLQVVCEKNFEIWSVVGANPIRFSLHEFEHLTGLNCEYKEDLDDPAVEVTDEMSDFWEKLGVDVDEGPSIDNLVRACGWADDWTREEKIRLAYLAIYAGFVEAQKSCSPTRVELARLVMDLEVFENYPWGRVAFKTLIRSVKTATITKGYYLDGFAEVLQVWAYYAMPGFGTEYGEPFIGNVEPPMLAFKGARGRKYIMNTFLGQVKFNHMVLVERADVYPHWDDDSEDEHVHNVIKALYNEFGGPWKWKPSDWHREGLIVCDNVKAVKGHGKKRLLNSQPLPGKKPYADMSRYGESSDGGWKTFEKTMKTMLADFAKQQSDSIAAGFRRCDEKFGDLSTKVVLLESAISKLQGNTASEDLVKSNEAEHVKSNDPSLKEPDAAGLVSPANPVSLLSLLRTLSPLRLDKLLRKRRSRVEKYQL